MDINQSFSETARDIVLESANKYPYVVYLPQRPESDDQEFEDYLSTFSGLWFRNCVWNDSESPEEFYFADEKDAIMFTLKWK